MRQGNRVSYKLVICLMQHGLAISSPNNSLLKTVMRLLLQFSYLYKYAFVGQQDGTVDDAICPGWPDI